MQAGAVDSHCVVCSFQILGAVVGLCGFFGCSMIAAPCWCNSAVKSLSVVQSSMFAVLSCWYCCMVGLVVPARLWWSRSG